MKFALPLLLSAAIVCAQPTNFPSLTLVDGETYTHVVVTAVEPDGLRISHNDGAGKIRAENLPPEIAAQFKFDAASAAEFREKSAAQQKEFAARSAALAQVERDKDTEAARIAALEKDAKEIRAKIFQVLPDGVLADVMEASVASSASRSVGLGGGAAVSSYHSTGKDVFIEGVKGKAEGDVVLCEAAPNGTYEYLDVQGIKRVVSKFICFKIL